MKYLMKLASVIICFAFISSCAPRHRAGMITDPETGLQYGSVIEKSFFIDPSQFDNDVIKITARNVSGDANYNIREFIYSLKESFSQKGYAVKGDDNFGIKFDVVIEYSGHIQENMMSQYGFLGATTGGIIGYRSNTKAGTAIGVLSGATLGSIVGSYITDDTYIVISRVTLGIIDTAKKSSKSITFGASPKLQKDDTDKGIKSFKEVVTTKIAVFAGGRNVKQSEIVEGVKRRLNSIVADII
jgi:hypothetical protein